MTGAIFRFGREFSLSDGGTFRGFLRPVNPPVSREIRRRTVPGIALDAEYMLIAPAGIFLDGDEGARVFRGEEAFELLRAEEKIVGGRRSHAECLLRLVGGG